MKHGHAQPTFTDPVCGMKLSLKTAIEETEYRGRMYYFCAQVCREAIEARPEQYVRTPQPRNKEQ